MAASKRKIKTVARSADPIAFIEKVKSDVKRKDSYELVAMMQDITGAAPRMWGPSIVGFGCLYINKLDDVDRRVLRKLIEHSIAELRAP